MVTMKSILQQAPMIPVITLTDIRHAVPLAQALLAGGITVLEITLRTPIALEAIRSIKQAIPTCILGAGTIVHSQQFTEAKSAGASFAVSPGIHEKLIEAARAVNLPYLPGVLTPSEALLAIQHELSELKFFPATLLGGIPMLHQLSLLYPNLRFCTTGGIDSKNFMDYLALPNVLSIGGSWLTPSTLIQKGQWDKITRITKKTLAQLRRQ